jgi:hypothetical protein
VVALGRLAVPETPCDTRRVGHWGSYSFVFGPALSLVAVGVLTLLLRWAFGHNRSLVARRPRPGAADEYGLLVRVAAPPTFVEAEVMRRHLEAAGVRATLAPTIEGPAVMVFPDDAPAARLALQQYRPPAA